MFILSQIVCLDIRNLFLETFAYEIIFDKKDKYCATYEWFLLIYKKAKILTQTKFSTLPQYPKILPVVDEMSSEMNFAAKFKFMVNRRWTEAYENKNYYDGKFAGKFGGNEETSLRLHHLVTPSTFITKIKTAMKNLIYLYHFKVFNDFQPFFIHCFLHHRVSKVRSEKYLSWRSLTTLQQTKNRLETKHMLYIQSTSLAETHFFWPMLFYRAF